MLKYWCETFLMLILSKYYKIGITKGGLKWKDYLKSKNVWSIAFLTLLVSITIEIVQLKIGRTFDIDDCLLNTCGGILGFYTYNLIEKITSGLPKVFKTDGFINFLVILILILIIIYLSDWQVVTWINK